MLDYFVQAHYKNHLLLFDIFFKSQKRIKASVSIKSLSATSIIFYTNIIKWYMIIRG